MSTTASSGAGATSARLRPDLVWGGSLKRLFLGLTVLGGLVFLAGTMIEPERAWGGYLIGFNYFVGLAIAGPLFLSIIYLSDARWAKPLRFVPEGLTATLPVAFALGLALMMGTHALFEWSHAHVVEHDPLLSHKAPYLNVVGFAVRMVVCFSLWIWLGRRVARRSRATEAQPARRRADLSSSALFLAVLSVTFSLASIDWIQSLDPHWFSTMFALRTLSGVGCSGLALCMLVAIGLHRSGRLRGVVTHAVMDDLAKVLLGLSLFWAYIWYCEYMIIWYSDMPEETGYYLLRYQGGWETLMRLNLVVNFAVPFLALMLRSWRRNGVVLMRIAAFVLIGRALDLYVLIAPPVMGGELHLGAWELGPLLGALGLFGWSLMRALARGMNARAS